MAKEYIQAVLAKILRIVEELLAIEACSAIVGCRYISASGIEAIIGIGAELDAVFSIVDTCIDGEMEVVEEVECGEALYIEGVADIL